MKTVSKEELKKILNDDTCLVLARSGDMDFIMVKGKDILDIAHELQGQPEQVAPAVQEEPVFEVEISGEHWLNAGPVKGVDLRKLPEGVNKLYASPPAPVVPDEWTWEQARRFCRDREISFPVEAAHSAVQQYRTDMLTQPTKANNVIGQYQGADGMSHDIITLDKV